jgi:hypothetical protein
MNHWQFRGQALVKKDNLAFENTNFPNDFRAHLNTRAEALA